MTQLTEGDGRAGYARLRRVIGCLVVTQNVSRRRGQCGNQREHAPRAAHPGWIIFLGHAMPKCLGIVSNQFVQRGHIAAARVFQHLIVYVVLVSELFPDMAEICAGYDEYVSGIDVDQIS